MLPTTQGEEAITKPTITFQPRFGPPRGVETDARELPPIPEGGKAVVTYSDVMVLADDIELGGRVDFGTIHPDLVNAAQSEVRRREALRDSKQIAKHDAYSNADDIEEFTFFLPGGTDRNLVWRILQGAMTMNIFKCAEQLIRLNTTGRKLDEIVDGIADMQDAITIFIGLLEAGSLIEENR